MKHSNKPDPTKGTCGIQFAKHIGLGWCDRAACGCNQLYVHLLNADEEIFAVGSLSPEDVLVYAEQIRSAALKMLGGEQ